MKTPMVALAQRRLSEEFHFSWVDVEKLSTIRDAAVVRRAESLPEWETHVPRKDPDGDSCSRRRRIGGAAASIATGPQRGIAARSSRASLGSEPQSPSLRSIDSLLEQAADTARHEGR
jgi:hypothetical protein